nr:OmpH family outer membrane protein [Pontibacter ruber]
MAIAACNQQKPGAGATTAATGEAAAATPEIAYVNSDSLLTNYEYFKDVRTRLQGKSQKAEQNLKSQAQAFEKEVARYQQSAAGMSPQQRATTEQRLAQKQQQLQSISQSAGNDLAAEEGEEMKKIYDRVEAYLKQLSQEKGYKMVLTYSRGNSAILYGDSTLDITTEVLAGLNEKYKSEKDTAKADTTKKEDSKK